MGDVTALATRADQGMAVMPAEMTIEELVARTRKVQEAMKAVMKDGEHYGVIPGTPKPTLLKPGAEKLLNLFMLDPEYVAVREAEDGGHLTITSTCTLYHIGTGARLGSGMGSCSTRESRYAYRHAHRTCPGCGAEAIIQGKAEYGGGWLCFKKKGGCGAKYKEGDATIEGQAVGRVANEDKADQYNTILKMANKRSLVAAVLNVTAASDIFTQDLEDMPAAGSATQRPIPPVVMTADEIIPVPDGDERAEPAATTPATSVSFGDSEAGLDAALERARLLPLIKGLADHLGLKAPERARLWAKHCGHATPENADPAALATIHQHLLAAAEGTAAAKAKKQAKAAP